MPKAKSSAKDAGFSLIEAMLAMLFLAVSLLALGQLVGVAINQNAMSRSTSVGISLAMGMLEELRSQYNQQLEAGAVTLSSGEENVENEDGEEEAGDADGDGFRLIWTVTNGPGPNERIVTVTALPTAGEFLNSRTVEITSHFAP